MKVIKKIFKYILILAIFSMIFLLSLAGYTYYKVSKKYPVEILENYEPIKPSIIYDIKGRQIDVLALENRDPIKINDIPIHVQNAFLAVEDKRFKNHYGLDYLRLAKAVYLNVFSKSRQGGSTITQQLVKNAFLTRERSIKRKIEEAVLATEMERIYTKDEILEYYLNTINFGKGVYGIKNASLKYFGVLPDKLTIAQAATLASIPKSPAKYSKLKNARARHLVVLKLMYDGKFISEADYNKSKLEEIDFVTSKKLEEIKEASEISNSNIAPEITSIVLSEMKRILGIKDDEENELFSGYKVYSTIDIDMQKAAYNAFRDDDNLNKIKELEASLISIDSNNGFIKAIVGGKNNNKGDFNRALQANRQVGSNFKPVVYLTALDEKYPMNIVLEDSLVEYGEWIPSNYNNMYKSNITMLKALETSNNIASIKLLEKVGIDKVRSNWYKAGIKTKDFPENLTLALGSISTSPYELAKFYVALSNGGYKVEPKFIYKIENRYGEVIYDANIEKVRIYDKDSVNLMTYMLANTVKHGASVRSKVYKNGKLIAMAGKTGTTNDNVTAWFSGYTPNLTTVVYVGRDDNMSMGKKMTGSAAAIPIWKRYMQSIVDSNIYNVGDFTEIIDGQISGKYIEKRIDITNGLLDNDNINAEDALFKKGTEPIENEKDYISMFDIKEAN
ncbi:transglycosylase domain-containing protein [Oceanivirga miroungae]|uniref:Penicillin-binding protein n=1 Tax=Oceanivirga miroungae TaxID=1130046 RepID=A0A6I8M816_9FUSO|nr:transglycosylase domain-containing protein [Oceanivirga miroungae]VWL85651.1 penicillin-binding protein [Oceanivirga miroungae]